MENNVNRLALLFILISSSAYAEDTVVVLDTSHSMRLNRRMEIAKKALVDQLKTIPEGTKLGIISFQGWVYELQPLEHRQMELSLNEVESNPTMTPLYQYIGLGGKRLLEERRVVDPGRLGYNYKCKLLIVTDGLASDNFLNLDGSYKDGRIKPGIIKYLIQQNVTIDVIGLDLKEGHSLQNEINGVYYDAFDLVSLSSAIKKSVKVK